MALMTCPECGKIVSTLAESCPHCGCLAETFMKHWSPEHAIPKEVLRQQNMDAAGGAGKAAEAAAQEDQHLLPVTVVLPEPPMNAKDDVCLIVRSEDDRVLKKAPWGTTETVGISKPTRMSLKPVHRRNPLWGILSVVLANVLLLVPLMAQSNEKLQAIVDGPWVLAPLALWALLGVFGVFYLIGCGRREMVSFIAEPKQTYRFRWEGEKLICTKQ